jgi:hypothetical protein
VLGVDVIYVILDETTKTVRHFSKAIGFGFTYEQAHVDDAVEEARDQARCIFDVNGNNSPKQATRIEEEESTKIA